MKVVLHTFGASHICYLQSTFLIINLLRYRNSIESINVITEYPQYYKKLEKYINIIPVTNDTITSWKGEAGFIYRVKLKAMELIINQNSDRLPVLYLDTDTFIYQGFDELRSSLLRGKGIMHNNEGKLSECRTRSGSRMWNGIKNHTFGDITLSENDDMWNAGVIGVPANICSEFIDSAIRICDDICKKIPIMFLIEQFSASVALQRKVEMQSASSWIGHYWGNREGWNKLISAFITESYMKDYTIDEDIERMRRFNFGQIPIALIPTNTERKLLRLINKYFKPKVHSTLEYIVPL